MRALIWVVTGVLAGWIAGKLMKGRDYGFTGNLILGLFGSLVGGWLLEIVGASAPNEWWKQALVAALGALVVLGAARRLRPMTRQTRSVIGSVAAATVDFETQFRRLSDFERRVMGRLLQGAKVPDPNATFDEQLTFGQRIADQVAKFGGSWTFIGVFLLCMLAWMITNTVIGVHVDPYPFILLNLMLSCVAALQAPIIMMSQNRQAQKDRHDAKNDYEVNIRAELEINRLHEKIDERDLQIRELMVMNQRQLELLDRLVAAGPGER